MELLGRLVKAALPRHRIKNLIGKQRHLEHSSPGRPHTEPRRAL